MKITNSVELLDWFRSVADIDSDYMVSKLTGISKQALSYARTGEREFSEHTALKLLLVGEHPEPLNILALMEANKAEKLGKTDLANLWRKSVA